MSGHIETNFSCLKDVMCYMAIYTYLHKISYNILCKCSKNHWHLTGNALMYFQISTFIELIKILIKLN